MHDIFEIIQGDELLNITLIQITGHKYN